MRFWMRVAAAMVLGGMVLGLAGCCTPPAKIATVEGVSVRYETRAREGQEALSWGPEDVKKIVLTPDQLLVFEKSNRVQAVPLLDLEALEWERVSRGKVSGQ